jgi:hypothetical protein
MKNKRYGWGRRGDELHEELQWRETRIQRIREARRALRERAREQAQSTGRELEQVEPAAKVQYKFTDPLPRLMNSPDGFEQAYITQITVEPNFQFIVGQRGTQAANDKQQLVPLMETIQEQSGQKLEEVLGDSGYCSEENLKHLTKKNIDGFVATGKQRHSQRREPCKLGPLAPGETRVEQKQSKLETKVGAAVYAMRKAIVEPVFGQIKQRRGFRQLLLRGIDKVRGNWLCSA